MFDLVRGFVGKYIGWIPWILLGVATATAGVQTFRLKTLQTDFAEHLTADAEAQTKAEQKARDTEKQLSAVVNDISEAYERGKKDAQVTQTTLFADLNAANVRLRPTWRCEAARLPANAPAPSQPGPAERDRNESASRIVGAAAGCDAQVKQLQQVYNEVMVKINGR